MVNAGAGAPATDEIPAAEMGAAARPPEKPGRVAPKRVRDSTDGNGSHGFCGVATSEKKPTLQPHGTHGLQTLPDSNALRLSSSPPGENLEDKTKRATKVCTFYAEGRCKKGKSCTSLHEREDPDSRWNHGEKAGLVAPAGCGGSRGSEEESQVHLSNLKNHEPFMGRHSSLTAETYLDVRASFPRLLDGRNLQFVAEKGSSLSGSHVSRSYTLNSDHRYQSFNLPISSEPLQDSVNFGGTTENLPHQKEHYPSHALYSSHSLAGFRNPGYATSGSSFGSPALRATPHLGVLSHHQLTPGIGKVGLHKYVDVDKGYGTSSPALLASHSPQPSIMPPVSLSPIKDEVWQTSVPFVPSFDFPDIAAPSRSQYDPLLDSLEPPKVESASILKSSNISGSVSRQRTPQHVATETTDKSLNCNDRLTRNVSVNKGSNELAYLIASYRGLSSSLEDNNKVLASDRKNNAASNNEKTRLFRFHLAEYVKELIKPFWKDGQLSKEAHKLVVKKSVDKVVDSIEAHQVPTTEELITNYITAAESKIEKLVKAYVDRHRTK